MIWESLKIILAVVIIIGLVGLLFGTEYGRKFLDLLKLGAGKIVSGLSSLLKISKPKTEGYLPMVLSAEKESFYGKEFTVTDSVLNAKGNCLELKINEAVISISECEVSFSSGNGTLSYLNGNVQGSLDATGIAINTLSVEQAKIDFKITPTEFFFTGIKEEEISVFVKSGELKLSNPDGTPKCTIPLKNKITKISDFSGGLELKDDSAFLKGTAVFKEDVCSVVG